MLQALSCLHDPSLDLLEYAHVSLVLDNPALDTALQMCLPGAEQRGRITSFDLLEVQPKRLLSFFARRMHDRFLANLSTRTPRTFSAKPVPTWCAPNLSCCVC